MCLQEEKECLKLLCICSAFNSISRLTRGEAPLKKGGKKYFKKLTNEMYAVERQNYFFN